MFARSEKGVIADFDVTECMLRYFIRRVQPKRTLIKRPRIVIAVPSGITEVEKRAVQDSAYRAGAREVYLIEEPIAAALGIGLPIEEPRGNMVIDIGGGTTEISVTSLGGIVYAHSIRIGGDYLDRAIIEYIDRYYNLLIGEPTAEEVKIKIGSAAPLEEELEMDVIGKDKTIGLPKVVRVTSEEIRQALDVPIKEIVKATKITLDNTPPELAADLIERGIVMCGGGSLLRNLSNLIAEQTGLPVMVADDPLTAVVMGTGKVLEEMKYLRDSRQMKKSRLS
jgi:rod shape-determining protein MreB